MGYTHYYSLLPAGDQNEWTRALIAVGRIIQEQTAVRLANAYGDRGTQPEFSDARLAFNGVGDDAHETFSLPTLIARAAEDSPLGLRNGEVFEFTKTARKPYDLIVVACLATLEHYAPSCVRVGSDGDATEWVDGINLARALLDDHSIGLPRALATLDPRDRDTEWGPRMQINIDTALAQLR